MSFNIEEIEENQNDKGNLTFSAEPLHDDDIDQADDQNIVEFINNDLKTLNRNQFTASLDSIEALAKNLNHNSEDEEQENNQLIINNGKTKKFPSGGDADSPTFDKTQKIQFEEKKIQVEVVRPKSNQTIPMGVLLIMFSFFDFEALYKMSRVSKKIRESIVSSDLCQQPRTVKFTFDSEKTCDIDDLQYIVTLATQVKISFCHLQKRDFGVLQIILNHCKSLSKKVKFEFVNLKQIDTEVFIQAKMKKLITQSINEISFSYPRFLQQQQSQIVDYDFEVPIFNLYEKEQLHMKSIDFMEFLSPESESKEIYMDMLGFQSPSQFEKTSREPPRTAQFGVAGDFRQPPPQNRPAPQAIRQHNIRRDLEAQEIQEGIRFQRRQADFNNGANGFRRHEMPARDFDHRGVAPPQGAPGGFGGGFGVRPANLEINRRIVADIRNPAPHSIRNFQSQDGQPEKYDIEMLKQIIMTFAENFEDFKTLNFDFRKYQSFFYQLTDNDFGVPNSIFGSQSNLKILNLQIDTWTRTSIQKLIQNFQHLDELNIKYTILASEIKNIKRDNSQRQVIDLRHNRFLKKVTIDINLEDFFMRAIERKNIKLNFNFIPVIFSKDQIIDYMAVKVSNFNLNFEDVLPLKLYENDGVQFVWNIKKFDLICNELKVKKAIQTTSLEQINMKDLSLKIPFYPENNDIESNIEDLEYKELKMTNFGKLEDTLDHLTFEEKVKTSYQMNLKSEEASINLYFEKLNMNIQMV